MTAYDWEDIEVPEILKGDFPGHPFRGNQYVSADGKARGAGRGAKAKAPKRKKHFDSGSKTRFSDQPDEDLRDLYYSSTRDANPKFKNRRLHPDMRAEARRDLKELRAEAAHRGIKRMQRWNPGSDFVRPGARERYAAEAAAEREEKAKRPPLPQVSYAEQRRRREAQRRKARRRSGPASRRRFR